MKPFVITSSLTTFNDKSFEKYLTEVSRIPQLTVEEEVEIAKKANAGDQDAVHALVLHNLRFVISVANQYKGRGAKLEDLVTEGNLGLIQAAGRYDYTKGFKFISFAVWYIRKNIFEYLANNSRLVRIPSNKLTSLYKLKAVKNNLEQILERPPTEDEIYYHSDDKSIKKESISDLLEMERDRYKSTNDKVGENNDRDEVGDMIESYDDDFETDNWTKQHDLKIIFKMAFKRLTKMEREVIKLSFGIEDGQELNNKQVAEIIGKSSEHVRMTKKKVFKKLYHIVGKSNILETKTYL